MSRKPLPKKAPNWVWYGVYTFLFAVILGTALGPTGGDHHLARQSSAMQASRVLALCLNAYAADHDGRYPEGKSSTEVFQQLLDQHYLSDPAQVFVNFPGKTHAQGNRLQPENVGWDITCCIDAKSPDSLPVVFFTGYIIDYKAGAPAVPRDSSPRTWSQWWKGPDLMKVFTAVTDKGGLSQVKRASPDGSIPNFIPEDFDPKGKIYRQLIP